MAKTNPVCLSAGGLKFTMDTGIPHIMQRDARVELSHAPVRAALGDVPADARGKYVEADCLFATEEPFNIEYFLAKPGGDMEFRMGRCQLDLSEENVSTSYALDSPAGIPIGWRHYLEGNPVGRVLSMELEAGELRGRVRLSEAEISAVMAGGMRDLRAGMNAGMSIGFNATKIEQVKVGEGTAADPDQITYKGMSIYEVSLTPLPRIPSAGILDLDTEGGDSGETQPQPDGDSQAT